MQAASSNPSLPPALAFPPSFPSPRYLPVGVEYATAAVAANGVVLQRRGHGLDALQGGVPEGEERREGGRRG